MFIDANTRFKGVEMGDHEIKILNFPDGTTFLLLRDINRNTRIQSILRSHKEASSSKTNFSKI